MSAVPGGNVESTGIPFGPTARLVLLPYLIKQVHQIKKGEVPVNTNAMVGLLFLEKEAENLIS